MKMLAKVMMRSLPVTDCRTKAKMMRAGSKTIGTGGSTQVHSRKFSMDRSSPSLCLALAHRQDSSLTVQASNSGYWTTTV